MALLDRITSLFAAPAAELAPKNVATEIDYSAFGYIPHIAQQAQNTVYPNPHLNPQPYFDADQLAQAVWFTTRNHLAPIGQVPKTLE